MSMSISQYLVHMGFSDFEGNSADCREQVKDLIDLSRAPGIKVMEIGFNAGHSAEIFLKNNPTLSLVSFDVGWHPYIETAKNYIEMTFPGRHRLIIGDSTKTVPVFIKENPTTKFDLIFIDGGHEYDTAKADLENSLLLSHKDTIIAIDDVDDPPEHNYTIGPTTVWKEGKLATINQKVYDKGRGMAWGTPHRDLTLQ